MATSVSLTLRDLNVLAKIRDPESDPSSGPLLGPFMPKDPHVVDPVAYAAVSRQERDIIQSMQEVETRPSGHPSHANASADNVRQYRQCVAALDKLIEEYPQYASARNNRAQALRRLAGDSMLLAEADPKDAQVSPQPAMVSGMEATERQAMARTALNDLDRSISLLTPAGSSVAISPQAARTLSLAHTQRAAIYHMTAKSLHSAALSVAPDRPEGRWTELDFEESAARDFFLGGRYGNDIAKGLAVSTNPTAKLCGQMVREAMKREYGEGFAAAG